MSTLLDDETVVLDALDFEMPCAVRHGSAAEFSIRMCCCGENALLCGEHVRRHRESVELAFRIGPVVCGTCGAGLRSWAEAVEVVPL